jgi:hypothetical protein
VLTGQVSILIPGEPQSRRKVLFRSLITHKSAVASALNERGEQIYPVRRKCSSITGSGRSQKICERDAIRSRETRGVQQPRFVLKVIVKRG